MANNTAPIIIKVAKKSNKKRKYTKGLQSIQMSEVALTRGANRFADAVSSGLSDYRKRRDRSSRKKRNGMLVDYVPNVGYGISRIMSKASKVPYDISKAIAHREFKNAMTFVAKTMNNFKYPD